MVRSTPAFYCRKTTQRFASAASSVYNIDLIYHNLVFGPIPMIHNAHLEGNTFLWNGGSVGVLLSHGYTATTAEVRLLAQALHQQGYTVAGPLLPGHGTTPDDMNRYHWHDWVAAMDNSYRTLTQHCDTIFVGGESMGGLLALYVASEHPEIAGVLTYAPALKVPRRPLVLSYMARPFKKHVVKGDVDRLNPNWQGYPVNPLPALHQLHGLQRALRPRLPQIEQPLLVVQGRRDTAIDLRAVEKLIDQVSSPLKEFHWMEDSGHVVILDKELAQVSDITLQFLARVLDNHR
jgi:carboxylesterase